MAHEAEVERAVELAREGKEEEAREILKEVLRQDRGNLAAWLGMARLANNETDLFFSLKQVLQLDPSNEWASNRLAQLEAQVMQPPPPEPPRPAASEGPLLDRFTRPQAEPEEPKPAPRRKRDPQPEPPSLDSLRSDLNADGDISDMVPDADADDVFSDEDAPELGSWLEDLPPVRQEEPPLPRPPVRRRTEPARPRPAAAERPAPAPRPAAQQPGRRKALPTVGLILLLVLCAATTTVAVILSTQGQEPEPVVTPTYEITTTGRMQVGDSGTRTIYNDDEVHTWIFDAEAGQRLDITVNGVGDADPVVTLLDQYGGFLVSDDDSAVGTGARLLVTMPYTGTYYLQIETKQPGSYEFTFFEGR